jgi:hypothetical protein
MDLFKEAFSLYANDSGCSIINLNRENLDLKGEGEFSRGKRQCRLFNVLLNLIISKSINLIKTMVVFFTDFLNQLFWKVVLGSEKRVPFWCKEQAIFRTLAIAWFVTLQKALEVLSITLIARTGAILIFG